MLQDQKVRFTVFLIPSLAKALQAMSRKKRNQFVNEKLMDAMERENLFSAIETMKHAKTNYKKGPDFIKKIRSEWTL